MGFLFPEEPPTLVNTNSEEIRTREDNRRRRLAAAKGNEASRLTDDEDGVPGISKGSQTVAQNKLLGE